MQEVDPLLYDGSPLEIFWQIWVGVQGNLNIADVRRESIYLVNVESYTINGRDDFGSDIEHDFPLLDKCK